MLTIQKKLIVFNVHSTDVFNVVSLKRSLTNEGHCLIVECPMDVWKKFQMNIDEVNINLSKSLVKSRRREWSNVLFVVRFFTSEAKFSVKS